MGEQTMRAFTKRSMTPRDAATVDWPRPEPGAGEALLRVAGCGVCGSDLHAYNSDPGYEFVAAPVVMGHELAGEVVEVGPGTDGVQPGDRAVVVSTQGCGRCELCLAGTPQICESRQIIGLHYDGGLAEYVKVAERHLVAVPDGLDLVHASLAEPLSVAVHAVRARTPVRPGDRVVVSGPGPIGLCCAKLAQLAGGEVLLLGTDADAATRLPLGEQLGLRTANVGSGETADPVADAFRGAKPDTWIEASGAIPALTSALEGLRPGGTLTVVAHYAKDFTFFPSHAIRRQLTFNFSFGSVASEYRIALDLLHKEIIPAARFQTVYPLEAGASAVTASAAGQVVKAVLVPGT